MTKKNENNNLTSCGSKEGFVSIDITERAESEINALRALLCEPFPNDHQDAEASRLLPGKALSPDSFYSTSDSEDESVNEDASFFSNKGCFYRCLGFFRTLRGRPQPGQAEIKLVQKQSII